MTTAKQAILDNSKPNVLLFTEELFNNGTEYIPISNIYKISSTPNPFIFIQDLYYLYVDWHKRTNNGKL